MHRAVQALAVLALAAMAFFFTVAGIASYRLWQRLDPLITDTRRVVLSVGGTAADLRKIADAAKLQSEAESAAITQATRNLTLVTASLNADLQKIGETTDQARAALIEQNKGLTMLGQQASVTLDDARDALADLKPTLQAATDTLRGTAALTNDPEIQQAVEHANATLTHLDATSASAERDAAMLETRLRQILKPASLAKRMFMWLLQTIPPVITAAK